MSQANSQQARRANLSSTYGKESRKRAQRSLLKQKSKSRSLLVQNTVKNISICQDLGQMQNISSFHNAFFQEFGSHFQLASVTLWLSLSIFPSFSWSPSSSTHHYFRPFTDVRAEQSHHSHVQKSLLTACSSWNPSISSTSPRITTPRSTTACQLRGKHSRGGPTQAAADLSYLPIIPWASTLRTFGNELNGLCTPLGSVPSAV